MNRHNVPLHDGTYERVSVCAGSIDHTYRIRSGATFVVSDDDAAALGGWPSYCALCHIGHGYSKELKERLLRVDALERIMSC